MGMHSSKFEVHFLKYDVVVISDKLIIMIFNLFQNILYYHEFVIIYYANIL